MKLICERTILNGAVTPALSAVSAKATKQASDCLLLTADKDTGTLIICGYDTEKGVKVTVSGEGLQIDESGAIIVNAEKFSSVIKNLPDGNVSIEADGKFIMTVESGRSSFTLHGLDSTTFPAIPELKGEKSLTLPRKTLKSMIASTLFSAANNAVRPALNGVLFEMEDNRLNVVSCDGYRVSLRRCSEGLSSGEKPDCKFIIPGKSLGELLKLISDGEQPAAVELTAKHVIISFDNIIFFARLIESEFINYSRVTNVTSKTTVIANTRSFQDSIERAALLTDDKQNQIRLSFRNGDTNIENSENAGTLQITSSGALGKSYDECGIEIHGDDITMGLNHRYLYEALRAVKEEKVVIQLESALKPLVVLPYGQDTDIIGINTDESRYIYLVLPVRLREERQEEIVKKAS